MRIGFFSDRYLPQIDGVATSIESFRTELEKLGHEVYIVAPAPGLRFKETNSHVIRFRAVKGLLGEYDYLTSLFFPPTVARQLDEIGLDVIHFHTPGQVGLLGAYYALRNNIPLVTTYHTDLFEYVKHYPGVLPGILALSMMTPWVTGGGIDDFRVGLSNMKPERSVDKWNQKIVEHGVTLVHNYCDLVIAPSVKMEQQLHSWHTKTRIEVLPTGIDEIITTKSELSASKLNYGIKPDDELILSVGRVGTEKNLELLIRSFEIIAPRRPKSKLMIVGDGPALESLKEQATSAGLSERVIFPGRIEHNHLGSIFGLAKVFAFPSLADTQGLVLNEAALAGLPLVVCDSLISDIMIDGQTGLLSGPRDQDFAAKLTWLLDHPTESAAMGQAGRAVAKRYSASTQAEKLLRLYQESSDSHAAKQTRPHH